jgi:hypothetical protein
LTGQRLESVMTEAERQELEQCSRRIAELLYKEASEQGHPVSTLGGIESTVRMQVQEYVTPTIGSFFVKSPSAPKRDIPDGSTASSAN